MPRVRMDPEFWRLYARDYIRKRTTQREIAEALGKSQQAISKKMETMNFSLEEFRAVIKTTGMDDAAILRIVK